jgi:translation initiation factor IF-3
MTKDIVLRNIKTEPPIFKVMNYRMELMKRLFKKLGKELNEVDDSKAKSIRLTTNISLHDMENKKQRSI